MWKPLRLPSHMDKLFPEMFVSISAATSKDTHVRLPSGRHWVFYSGWIFATLIMGKLHCILVCLFLSFFFFFGFYQSRTSFHVKQLYFFCGLSVSFSGVWEICMSLFYIKDINLSCVILAACVDSILPIFVSVVFYFCCVTIDFSLSVNICCVYCGPPILGI